MSYKYQFIVHANFNVQNHISDNISSHDSYFHLDERDHETRILYFTSGLLDDLTDNQEIYDMGNKILSIYEGIYTLLDRKKQERPYFELQELYNRSNGQKVSDAIRSKIYRVDVDFSKIDFTKEIPSMSPIYSLFEKIVQDDFLTNLFFLLSNNVDYKLLYMIYDDIRHYLKSIGDNRFLDPFSKDLNNFTHTANNYEVLGYYARHGRTNNQPPKAPMDLETSKHLIFNIIVLLLEEKFGIKTQGLTPKNTQIEEANWEDLFNQKSPIEN